MPLWVVCSRAHWRRCQARGRLLPARSRDPGPGLRVALHANVGTAALEAFGPCRNDLLALALDPRALPGAGPDTRVRVDLDVDGRPMLWIDCSSLALDVIVEIEQLRPLDDDAGYHPPTLQTAADRDRARNRDGLKRTK